MQKKALLLPLARQMALPLAGLLASSVAGLATGCTSRPVDQDQRVGHRIPYVILITVDSLRQDALSVYGSETTTPHIDQFAQDAIVFRQAYAVAPWTNPSLASLMTGLSPEVHRMVYLASRLPDGVTTLAEYLRDDGYHTAAFGVNDLLTPAANLDQGFHHYEFHMRSTVAITQDVIQWLPGSVKNDFFLWVHYFDPHGPYQPPEELLPPGKTPERIGVEFKDVQAIRHGTFVPTAAEQAWIRKLYEAEVRYVDRSLGQLFGVLKALDLYDDSLVILTSDHGEELWDHGGLGHGHTLYQELLRVPLILKLPSPADLTETDAPVALPALMPTILDLCQVDYEEERISYASLTPLWRVNPESFEPRPIVGNALFGSSVVRQATGSETFKYIRSFAGDRSGEVLYNLSRDPGENTSIAESSPDAIQQAREILDAHSERALDLRTTLGLESGQLRQIPKDLMKELKTLGYVD